MRRTLVGLLLVVAVPPASATVSRQYPESPGGPVVDTLHGTPLPDPYRWLEDDTAADTRGWIAAQNAFREGLMADQPVRPAVSRRLEELLRVDIQGVPTVRANRYFFSKRAADQDLSVITMREGAEGPDVPLVDPNLTAVGPPLSVSIADVSEDGSLLAYRIQQGGEDEAVIRIYDVEQRRARPDILPRARYFTVEITPDNQGLFYARYDQAGPRLFHRLLGSPDSTERLVFGDSLGAEKILTARLSPDGGWMLVSVHHGTSGGNDLYLQDLKSGHPPAVMVREMGKNFSADFAGERIIIWTDWEAPRGRVLATTTDTPAKEQWREIIPQLQHVAEGFSLAGGHVWVNYLENVAGILRAFTTEGQPVREITMPALGSLSPISGDYLRDEAFFSFTSYHIPPTIYRYSVGRDSGDVWWRQGVTFDSDAYTVKQIWYTSTDGTRVPMFLAHRRDLMLDGTAAAYLTGYGGFYLNQTPSFSPQHAVWLEHGGVLAVPNLRGGGEFGEAWHQAGMFGKKQNVFDDFIEAAQWLVTSRYTNPERLAIGGGSNGGLLVAAALTQRPDLFRAVLCTYPLIDMLRFHRFLVGAYWISEYGSADIPEQFDYLRRYSPYHHVRSGVRYPAVFFDTGDADTRVAPLHARKMTALLQSATGAAIEQRPIVLRYDTEAGHSGGLPVAKAVELLTERLVFLMWQLGMSPVQAERVF